MLKIVWVGFHMEGIYAFSNLLKDGVKISALFTLEQQSAAKMSAGTNRYRQICDKYKVPYFEINHINDTKVSEKLEELEPDIIVVLGWSQILDSKVLKLPKKGVVGAHASLLPNNRGSAPVNWSIIKGETLTGNTLMWLDSGVDTGIVIDQIPIPISKYDTCQSIYTEVARTNYIMLKKLIRRLEKGEHPGRMQECSNTNVLPRRRPSDGIIDWTLDSVHVYDFIRALTRPYPGAFSFMDCQKWHIWKAALLPLDTSFKAGTVIGPVLSPEKNACGIAAACGKGALILFEIESDSGEVLKGHDLAEVEWKGKVWTDEQCISNCCPP